jgi:ribosome-binding factor A
MRKTKYPAIGKSSGIGRGPGSNLDREALQSLVGALREGDGIDPREEAKHRRRASSQGRAGLANGLHQQERFASQVQLAIDSALLTAASPILSALTVREVVKQGGTLLVIVVPRDPAEPLDLQVATKTLKQASSMLRREVASAITRKETPNLSFVVLPAGAEKVDE